MASKVNKLEFLSTNPEMVCARVSAFFHEPHFHDTFTIGLMREGSLVFHAQNHIYRAKPGEIFLLHPFEVHYGGNLDEGIAYDVLYPSVKFVKSLLKKNKTAKGWPNFEKLVFRDSPATREIFEELKDPCLWNQKTISYSKEKALRNLLNTSRKPETDFQSGASIKYKHVSLACNIMEEEYGAKTLIRDLANKLGLSHYYFTRLFHDITGLTPSVFLRQVRLAKAKNLILQGMPLAETALITGFADQSHMTRTFKDTYGFSPGILSSTIM